MDFDIFDIFSFISKQVAKHLLKSSVSVIQKRFCKCKKKKELPAEIII